MQIKEIVKDNSKEISNIYKQVGEYAEAAREFCKRYNYTYTDSWRRAVSRVLNAAEDITEEAVEEKNSYAKILIFDIETAPAKSYIWGAWNQNPGSNLDMIQADWFVLTWSAKWLFDDKILNAKLTPKEALEEDDSRIVKSMWELFNEADIVVAHNAKKFDIKKLNSRFLIHEYGPPLPYQVIDTLIHARKRFAMISNKLDWLARELGLEGKLSHRGVKRWDDCVKGNQQALDDMSKYNDQDVLVLEEVYLKMRPWIKPHPNIGLFIGEDVACCASCGSKELDWSGVYRTYANEYDAYRCNSCGSIGRSRKSNTPQSIKRNLTISTPS